MALSLQDQKVMSAADQAQAIKLTDMWDAADSQEQKDSIHTTLESIRSNYDYSGGDTGMENISLAKPPEVDAPVVNQPVDTSGGMVGQDGQVNQNAILQQILKAMQAPSQVATETDSYKAYEQNILDQTAKVSEQQMRTVSEEAGKRGILRSTITAKDIADVGTALGEQAQNMLIEKATQMQSQEDAARAQSIAEMTSIFNMAYKVTAENNRLQQQDFDNQQDLIDSAWKSVTSLGYANEEAAAVLGVEYGTPSYAAKKAADDRQASLLKAQMDLAAKTKDNTDKLKVTNPFYENMPTTASQAYYDDALALLQVSPERYDEVEAWLNKENAAGRLTTAEQLEIWRALSTYKGVFELRASVAESLLPEGDEISPRQHMLAEVNKALTDESKTDDAERIENAKQLLRDNLVSMSGEDYTYLLEHIDTFYIAPKYGTDEE